MSRSRYIFIIIEITSMLLLLSLSVFLTGCLVARPPVDLHYVSGALVESLSSNAALSYASPERNISGSALLMYRKPDQIRAVILSPFGSVLQEVYISGERVTIVDTGNGIAFSGNRQELPVKGDFSGWRHIHWLIDIDPPDVSRGTAVIERINRFGETEKASFENGMLVSKISAAGGGVRYGRYTALQGTAFPLDISYETTTQEKFTIVLEDPEINIQLAESTFAPNLSKLRVYPLSSLK